VLGLGCVDCDWLVGWSSLTSLSLSDEGGDGEALPNPQALLTVNEDRVGFDPEIRFDAGHGLDQLLMRRLHLSQFPLELLERLVDVRDFLDKAEMSIVTTEFHVDTVSPTLQTRLSHLEKNRQGEDGMIGLGCRGMVPPPCCSTAGRG